MKAFKQVEHLFQTLTQAGVSKSDSLEDSSKIILTNQLGLILIFVATPYFFIFKYFGAPLLGQMILPIVLLLLLTFYCNGKGWFLAAKLLIIGVPSFGAVIYSCILGVSAGIQHLFVAILTIPFVVFDFKKPVQLTLGMIIPVGSYFILEFLGYGLFPRHILEPLFLTIIRITLTTVTFFIALATIGFYFFQNRRSKLQLEQTNRDLKSAYTLLKSQSTQLAQVEQYRAYMVLTQQVAHELKNPLHLLGLTTYGMKKIMQNTDQLEQAIEMVDQTVKNMQQVLSAMLSAGQGGAQIEPVSVQSSLEKIVLLIRARCQNKGITIQDHFEKVPLVSASQQGLFQIFTNLVTNALNAMPDGGILSLHIRGASQNDQEGVLIGIQDTGPGIPIDQQATFFTRDIYTTPEGETHGFGLGIVRNLIEKFDGQISLDSNPTYLHGTTVWVWLKVSD
ncbi:MAG: sensor histidine kinase [Candidatus Margulisiibacteriota bacterium]